MRAIIGLRSIRSTAAATFGPGSRRMRLRWDSCATASRVPASCAIFRAVDAGGQMRTVRLTRTAGRSARVAANSSVCRAHPEKTTFDGRKSGIARESPGVARSTFAASRTVRFRHSLRSPAPWCTYTISLGLRQSYVRRARASATNAAKDRCWFRILRERIGSLRQPMSNSRERSRLAIDPTIFNDRSDARRLTARAARASALRCGLEQLAMRRSRPRVYEPRRNRCRELWRRV